MHQGESIYEEQTSLSDHARPCGVDFLAVVLDATVWRQPFAITAIFMTENSH